LRLLDVVAMFVVAAVVAAAAVGKALAGGEWKVEVEISAVVSED
jgi:hypothetical protein